MSGEPLRHAVIWDDLEAMNQRIDAGEMMRRLTRVLDAELEERGFRGEARFELRRDYPNGIELMIVAGHVYDTREALSLVVELRMRGGSRPLASYHLSGGPERIKASAGVAWIRAANGVVLIVGDGLGGIVEAQN